MKKVITILLMITTLNAMTSDVFCIPLGENYLVCSDSNGNEWTIYIGE